MDQYVAELGRQLDRGSEERDVLATENARLVEALSALQLRYDRLRTAELDERAQDILAAAEDEASTVVARGADRAAELVATAHQEALVITERARQEVAWNKRKLRAERADLAAQQLALRQQLTSLRDLAVDTAQQFPPGSPSADPSEPVTPQAVGAGAEQHA